MPRAYAHTNGAGGRPHDLIEHLRDTASQAQAFATEARPSDPSFSALASWAGWLHDLGKYRPEFQDYLFGRRPGGLETQHAVFGAARALKAGLPSAVCLAILGHHAGLHDWTDLDPQFRNPALDPLNASEALIRKLDDDRQSHPSSPVLPDSVSEFLKLTRRGLQATFDQELSIRMLFSCLVDADYLDTERHMTGIERLTRPFQAQELFQRLDAHVRHLQSQSHPTPVNESRRALYEACLANAELPPGGFRLTAPTGSGKTLAMMAFALKHAAIHARQHGFRRVIVVLPFLAIIEQNALVYRDILGTLDDGSPVVLEHHSAVQTEHQREESEDRKTGDSESENQVRSKQATENWDAPVIVTTAVQFLESLFARRPSRCRKLHNIARSVVLFDEVQTLPFPLLDPILSAVRDLRDHFGVSFLFASATQPTFEKSSNLPSGFKPQECREVVEDRRQTFTILRRTRLELPFLTEGKWSWDALAKRIKPEPRALIIVNLRKHAQDLYDLLRSRDTPNLFHLSSTMCTAHREAVLGQKKDPEPGTIYHALQNNEPCVVVSTQVVEAGVDVDFPIVLPRPRPPRRHHPGRRPLRPRRPPHPLRRLPRRPCCRLRTRLQIRHPARLLRRGHSENALASYGNHRRSRSGAR